MEEKNSIAVSIYCTAYNHEKYIRDALEGFVSQKTNFKYEVFVHDDASTDNTAAIIREYAKNYPDIIKPIYQKENQYSKGVRIVPTFIYPEMKGKYIAVCEGDDYWCSENKLQKQFDFLEAHPDYSACVHNSVKLDCRTDKKSLINSKKVDCTLKFDEIVVGGNTQFQTSSLMYRKEFFDMPEAFRMKSVGDTPRAVYLAVSGKIYYFKDVMSVYRLFSANSWNSRKVLGPDRVKSLTANNEDALAMLKRVDTFTKGEYHGGLVHAQRIREYNILKLRKEYSKILSEYKDILKEKGIKERVRIQIAKGLPFIEKLYWKLFGLINK